MHDGGKSAFPAPEHDHRHCVEQALGEAADLCRQRGARLTPIRRRVLELVWASHKAVGAYEILDALRSEHAGAAPPTVYRALDFLIAQGFVHRIESLNAFVGCPHPADRHAGQFLICLDCGAAAELD
ncbi:MAG: transcriptional repressor, partial [Rhodovibrionaceae bacterium]|nr:transcriptional repressor [Rhodovibrionaceae bacterium]